MEDQERDEAPEVEETFADPQATPAAGTGEEGDAAEESGDEEDEGAGE